MNGQTEAPPVRFKKEIPITGDGAVAVDCIAEATGLSKQQVKKTMTGGAIWLSSQGGKPRRLRRAKRMLKKGDRLHIYYDERVLSVTPEPPTLIADKEEYSVWYKPYGMLSQGSKWGDASAIGRWVERHITPQREVYTVHRLDRAATGLILLAHRKQTAAALTELFKKRAVEKRYRAIVHGEFPETPEPKRVANPLDGQEAVSHVKRLAYDMEKGRSLLEVAIETGRKHQIRRHLSMEGFPVVGDRLYGSEERELNLQLCAIFLGFSCPVTGKAVRFELPDSLRPKID